MSERPFEPTQEQVTVIEHAGSAIIVACPGAGKTRVMVERARYILRLPSNGRGIAFLSFTRAAVSELEYRLRRAVQLNSPVFPHFIGTFDGFIWHFLVAPFGIPGTEAAPRLIPDKASRIVQPFEKAHPLPLSCFDRATGKIDAATALRCGFDVNKKTAAHIRASETAAQKMQARFRERGELDFDDARDLAVRRLADAECVVRLSSALAARFCEVIVDEAHDCNPADLEIIKWLRGAAIPTTVICDPHQSIYEFRGGVTHELVAFADSFAKTDQLCMRGNFRSSDSICKAIVMLRDIKARNTIDEPLGEHKNEQAPIYILSYAGRSVPATIGVKFVELLNELKIAISHAPVLAATRNSGSNAIGQPAVKAKRDLTFRLAEAISDFYFAFESGNQKSAIEEVHKIILELEGRLSGMSYHQYVVAHDLKADEWRPQIVCILRALRYHPEVFVDADAWHSWAKQLLAPHLPADGPSISQKLKRNKDISGVLAVAPATYPPAKTIHSVKGMEFPAVCVVTVPQTLKGVLDYLETGDPTDEAETARELYVAASRAQRLLVIAVPKSQTQRFAEHIGKAGAQVAVVSI